MELWRVAHLAEHLRSDAPTGEKYLVIQSFVELHDDWMEAIVLLYHDSPSISAGWFTSRAPKHFGIHPEEWLELTRESPIVPLIASESDAYDSEWSVDDTFLFLSSLPQRRIGDIISDLSKSEAHLFWQVALNDSPCFSKRHMIRAFAQFTDYTVEELKRAVAFTPFLEVLERSVRGDLVISVKMEAGKHLTPPALYRVWNKVGLPFRTTVAVLIPSPRLYLHYTGTDAIVYTRTGELVQSWDSTHEKAIFEIECSDDYDPASIMYADVLLLGEKEWWKEKFSLRHAFLSEHYKQRVVGGGRKIDTVAEFRMLLSETDPTHTVRLIDDVAYYDDDFNGGYILHQQSYRLPLLLTHICETPIGIRVRLGALDGYSIVYVGEMTCIDDVGQHLRQILGHRITSKWTPIDDVGCISRVVASDIVSNNGRYHLASPNIISIDTKMGFGDAIQLSDIFSFMMKEY
jgi:hypothetical protein